MPGKGPFAHVKDEIVDFFAARRTVHFVPYAQADHETYTANIRAALKPLGVQVIGLPETSAAQQAIQDAEILFVGGGNSFRLLRSLQQLDLLDMVRQRVAAGTLRYMGSSAGSNMACPSLRTTNDMPIVQPASFTAFGLIPFQINPHYIDPDLASSHMGETRVQRIEQFLEANDVAVLGMREGAWLRRDANTLRLGGTTGARLFQRHQEPQELREGADLSWLLARPARFDQE